MRMIQISSGIVGAVLLAMAGFVPNAMAGCITDAELDAAVGDQVRAGAFTVNTASLGDRPLCSGLTMAQAIQRLSAAGRGEGDSRPRGSSSERPVATGGGARDDGRSTGLERYIGRLNSERIGGYRFAEHPVVLEGLAGAGVSADMRLELADYEVTNPIARQGEVIVDQGCIPHNCSDQHYKIFVNMRTGATAFCQFDANAGPSARWWIAGRRAPVTGGGECGESVQAAPAAVRALLVGGADAASAGQAMPDVTAALRFEEANACYSPALTALTGAMTEQASVSLGAARNIPVTRSGPDAEGWHTARAPLSARWNGLTITMIEYHFFPESDGETSTLVFRDTPAAVGAVLARLGFRVRRDGDQYETEEGLPTFVHLYGMEGETRLDCSH